MVRSTFGAEINAAIDTLEAGYLTQLAYCELFHRDLFMSEQNIVNDTICDRLRRLVEEGRMKPGMELGIDAASVFAAVAAQDVKDPAECSLKVHVLSIREALNHRKLKALWWLDTRDMLADALTKGGIDRAALVLVMEKGIYKPSQEFKVTRGSGQRTQPSPDIVDQLGTDE